MSELKDKLTKEVEEINKAISNPDEKAKVLNIIQEMISDFTKHVVALSIRQDEMDEKVTEIYDMLLDIESEIVEGLAEDVQAECPYCGEIIPLEYENGEFADFECPKCHNLIEMEMMFDEHGSCDCGCEEDGECDCCDCGCEEDGECDCCDCGCGDGHECNCEDCDCNHFHEFNETEEDNND